MASFSDAFYISLRPTSDPAQSDFFKPIIAQVKFSYSLLEAIVFLFEIDYFISAGFADRVARQPFPTRFQEILFRTDTTRN